MINELSDMCGVSGIEHKVREFIKSELLSFGLTVSVDKTGNVTASCNADKSDIVIFAPLDETGIIVTDITEEGYLKFDLVGDFDKTAIVSEYVQFEKATGVISFKAVHLSAKEEREKVELKSLYIDIGAKDKKDAKKYVEVGDFGIFESKCKSFGNGKIKGKALYSRIPAYVACECLKEKLKGVNLTGIFTVLNEVSYAGIKVAARSMPDAKAIVFLGAEDKECTDGKVFVGCHMNGDGNDKKIFDRVCNFLDVTTIKYEKFVSKNPAVKILKEYCQIPVICVSVPCLYKKTSHNVIDLKSVERMIQTVECIAAEVKYGE